MIELVLRLGLSLGIVLGLFWAIARTGSKRMGGSRSLLKVRSRQSLSRSSSVAVVEVGSRMLVVGVSDGGVRLLTELDPQELGETVAAPDGPVTASTAPGRRAARAPRDLRGLRAARTARTSGGKRRAGVPVTVPVTGPVTGPAPVAVPAMALEVEDPAPVAAQPAAAAAAAPAAPDFASVLAAARAAQAPVAPARPAPQAVSAPAPAPTLPDQLVAAMPAALVAIAEAELAASRPVTHVTQVAPVPAAAPQAQQIGPVPALAASSASASPLAGSILAPATWRSAWAAASGMAARTPRTAPQGRS